LSDKGPKIEKLCVEITNCAHKIVEKN